MIGKSTFAAHLLLLASVVPSCNQNTGPVVDCAAESAQARIEAVAGAVSADGSVTIYGTVEFPAEGGSGGEVAVRDVLVAGQEVVAGGGSFNFRTWTVSISHDRLVAYSAGSGRASLPVTVYLYGGCVVQLPASQEPSVPVGVVDGGSDGGAGDGGVLDDGSDGASTDGRADAADAADSGMGDATID